MQNLKLITSLIVAFFLAGCVTTKEVLVYRDRNILIAPPDDMITLCTITPPPEKKVYVEADWRKKENLLMDNIKMHYSTLQSCNVQLTNLQDWKAKQIIIHTTPAEK